MNKKVTYITRGGVIGALYVLFTMLSAMLGLSNGVIQIRFSEALCVLPMFFPEAVVGLFVGCLISNLLSGCVIWDVVFGSLATLIGAVGTRIFRKNKVLAFLAPILSNSLIIPVVLMKAYGVDADFWYLFLTILAGEALSVGVLGILVQGIVKKTIRFTK